MKDFDKCCGFAGEFAIKNPEISAEISAKKVKKALETKADYITTCCPSCVLGLTQGSIENNTFKPILNFVELILMAKKVTFQVPSLQEEPDANQEKSLIISKK